MAGPSNGNAARGERRVEHHAGGEELRQRHELRAGIHRLVHEGLALGEVGLDIPQLHLELHGRDSHEPIVLRR